MDLDFLVRYLVGRMASSPIYNCSYHQNAAAARPDHGSAGRRPGRRSSVPRAVQTQRIRQRLGNWLCARRRSQVSGPSQGSRRLRQVVHEAEQQEIFVLKILLRLRFFVEMWGVGGWKFEQLRVIVTDRFVSREVDEGNASCATFSFRCFDKSLWCSRQKFLLQFINSIHNSRRYSWTPCDWLENVLNYWLDNVLNKWSWSCYFRLLCLVSVGIFVVNGSQCIVCLSSFFPGFFFSRGLVIDWF